MFPYRLCNQYRGTELSTWAVASDVTGRPAPKPFVAVSVTRSLCPRSEDLTTYRGRVAPTIGVQLLPKESQSSHCSWYELGTSSQLPCHTVNCWPSVGGPEITEGKTPAGGADVPG